MSKMLISRLAVFQHPHRRVTFSTTNPVQDLQDASQHSYYDSGLEESETPSSKSSSGPRIGPLTLPEDHYERTTPDGSIGETEHPENGTMTPPPPPRHPRSVMLLMNMYLNVNDSDTRSLCECFVAGAGDILWEICLCSVAILQWSCCGNRDTDLLCLTMTV